MGILQHEGAIRKVIIFVKWFHIWFKLPIKSINKLVNTKESQVSWTLKLILFLFTIFLSSNSPAFAEKIIQQKKLGFSVCLKVIEDSAEKLSLVPEVTKYEETYRQAEFVLSDGILIIRCDGEKGTLTVLSE